MTNLQIFFSLLGLIGLCCGIWWTVSRTRRTTPHVHRQAATAPKASKGKRKSRTRRRAERKAKQMAEQAAQLRLESEARNLEIELRKLRQIPTSTVNSIKGYRIARTIRAISVDGHSDADYAESDFLRQVRAAGGTGVVNMHWHRSRGGYISISGDAVELS